MSIRSIILPISLSAVVALAACTPKAEKISACTENPVAKDFIETVTYPDGDYSETAIAGFDTLKTDFRKDQPSPVVVRWANPETRLDDVKAVVTCGTKKGDPLFCIPVEPGADSVLAGSGNSSRHPG